MSSSPVGGRLRAYLRFIIAVLWFFVARTLARHAALGLASEQWRPLTEQAMLLFLLLMGYASMGVVFDRQPHPISAQGLPRRAGWRGEAGLGLAVGWALAIACVLPMIIGGGIAIVLILAPSAWGWLLANALFFAFLALAEEVAFRGYGFQRFEQSVGSLGAALGFAAFYAIVQALVPGSTRASIAVSLALSFVLSIAYLAHAGAVGELGHQLWLEGQPCAGLRACHQRRQQPLARGAGQSHGVVLAHRRRLWPGRQLGRLLRFARGPAGRIPPHPRTGLQLQRASDRARRHSGGS